MSPAIALNKAKSGGERPKGAPDAPSGPRTVAVLHELHGPAGGLAGVSVAIGPIAAESGTKASGRPPQVRRFGPDQAGLLRTFLRDAGVDLVIRIIPAAEAICRLAPLPEGAATQNRGALAEALSLMAETDLPGQLPWYRRTAGLVSIDGAPTGLLIGWHQPAAGSAMSSSRDALQETLQGLPQLATGEAVALAAMLNSVREPNGNAEAEHPGAWIVSANPGDGAATILAVGKSGARVRSLRADGGGATGSGETWRASLLEAVEETLEAAGVDESLFPRAAAFSPGRASVVLSTSAQPLIAGERRDREWIDQHGIAAATLDVFGEPSAETRGLFNLHAVEPRERANPLVRLVKVLATPTRAVVVAVVCAGVLLGTRLGVAYARHQALTKQVTNPDELTSRLSDIERQVAFANTLKEKRWPMTKLLADISAAAPVGIELEMLEINQGEPISVRGTAESNALINQFRENLAKTRVFGDITTPNVGAQGGTVQFQLQARPTSNGVLYQAPPVEDFAANPLGKIIYGPDWVPDTSVAPIRKAAAENHRNGRGNGRDRAPATASTSTSDSSRSSSGTSGRTGSSSSSSSNSEAASKANSTPALSDADIAKLNKTQAMLEWTKRKKLAGEATDKAVKERLLSESEKCKKRMDEARAAEGAAK